MTVLTHRYPRAWLSRRAAAARALAVSVGAACAASTPPAAPVPPSDPAQLAPTQPAPAAAEPLDLTVLVRAKRAGVTLGVERGDTLKTGDFLELFVHLNQPAYLYVLELLPDGKPWMLFPQHGDRLLTAGTAHRVPEAMSQLLQIDAHDRTEDIYVVMSRAPVASIGPLVSALAPPPERRTPPSPRPPKPLRPDVRFNITTRRVILVDRPDQAPSVIDARDPSQGTFVVQLSFKHA